MTWHTEIVDERHFQVLLGTIRSAGGRVTSSCPCPDGYCVTYVTLDG